MSNAASFVGIFSHLCAYKNSTDERFWRSIGDAINGMFVFVLGDYKVRYSITKQ